MCGTCVTYARSATRVVTSTSADLSEQRGLTIALIGELGGELVADVFAPGAEGTQTTTYRVESRTEGEDLARPCEVATTPPAETIELGGVGGELLVGGATVTATETTITATSSSERESVAFDGLSSTSFSRSMTLTLRAVTTP